MFSYQPNSSLDANNNRTFYTQSLSTDQLSDFIEIDLSPMGLENTNVDLSQTTRIGAGFGKNKKWFVGVQRNLTKSANFSNRFFERENVSYRDAKNGLLVATLSQITLRSQVSGAE
jgi:hypothetical protein